MQSPAGVVEVAESTHGFAPRVVGRHAGLHEVRDALNDD
jgi:hypothetical protein